MLTWPMAGVRVATGFAVAVKAYTAGPTMQAVASGDYLRVPMAPGVPMLAPWAVTPFLVVTFLAGLALIWGRHHRASAAVCAVLVAYMIAADQQFYSNHTYLMGLLAGILACTGREQEVAARCACMGLLTAVYLFSGLAKLNADFLSGDVLAAGTPLPGWGVPAPVLSGLAAGAMAVELFLAVGLWWAATRRAAVLAGVALHVPIIVLMSGTSGRLGLLSFALLLGSIYPLFFRHGREPAQVQPAVR